jgi:hypothetical protein
MKRLSCARLDVLLGACLTVLASGCKGPSAVCPPPRDLQICEQYKAYTAALAEATVACTNTLGPDSFDASSGVLRRKFDTCTGPGPKARELLADVDDLLALQKFPGQDQLRECYVEPWKAWRQKFFDSGNRSCPMWQNATPVPGTDANVETVGVNARAEPRLRLPRETKPGERIDFPSNVKPNVKFGKEFFYYTVAFRDFSEHGQPCGDAQSCAALCTGGLAGFYQGTKEDRILGDALWWWDPTSYDPSTDPYRQNGYYHPMSYFGPLPGALFGHPNRVGEACSYWDGYEHIPATLCGPTCVLPPDVGCTTLCRVGACAF